MLPYRSVRDAAIADVGRAITMASGGALAFAPIEYVLAVVTYAGHASLGAKLRLAALVATLSLVLWLVLAVSLAVGLVGVRLIRAQIDPEAGRDHGWFVARPLARSGSAGPRSDAGGGAEVDAPGIRRGAPRVWGAVVTALVMMVALQRGAAWAIGAFKEPQLTAVLVAAMGVVAIGAGALLYRAAALAAAAGARALAPVLGPANPLGRWRATGVALVALFAWALAGVWFTMPQSRSVMPVRLLVSAVVVLLGMGFGALVHPRLPRARSRRHARIVAGAALALCTATFAWLGADLETKYMAITASPALDKLIGVVRIANDFDRDGFGTVLGEADCAPFDPKINAGAIDVPDDGIDQNCDGHDFSVAALAIPSGPTIPVPQEFRRPWNVLMITIDTVRYDHTTMGGYATGPKHRDTTPRLAELVKRSTSFTWTIAPSAGTMASIPAILTSKYFHSGIALDETVTRGLPPRIKPENTTLPEIMKRAGYATGVIGSHAWWNDWGLDQGVDEYDNSIGKTDDPYRVAADKVTDHILAFVTKHQNDKFFLWAHYIDPHGRYVAHPDVVDYGAKEEDLYDAELRWTDQEIGRLLAELRRLPSWQKTIIVITSDHGESMAEHNVPLGTHGTALYTELLHVPMIWYIPDNPGREVAGTVSNLDIIPTLAELCGIDVHDLSFEGKSLVTQLFTGRPDHDRIVFSETNAPSKERSATNEAWKLIYYLSSNVYELFDLKNDPGEQHNLAPSAPPSLAPMQQALQNWMDRVLYARDADFNQAYRQMSDVMSSETPPVATTGQTLDHGAIEVTGIGPAQGKPFAPGQTDVHVYFTVKSPPDLGLKLQVVLWPAPPTLPGALPGSTAQSALRVTADGAFPSTKWKVGDHVRERFGVTIPADWHGDVVVGLVAVDARTGARQPATGATPAGEATLAILGVLPLPAGSPAPPHP